MSSDHQLARLASLVIAEINRIEATVNTARNTLTTVDDQLTSIRTGLVALKEALTSDNGNTRIGFVLVTAALITAVVLSVVRLS